MVIDGTANEIIIDPDDERCSRASRGSADDRRPAADVDAERRRPATTADGVRIRLDANIEFPDDLAAARYAGAEGIGLYRSEFLLTGARAASPTRTQQYEIYRGMLEGMAPGSVTVRTFDVDEDQLGAAVGAIRRSAGSWIAEEERGSRQGLRGLRLSLTRPELFQTQLRALLRAARHGSLRIMFPFVSGVEQVREARRHGRRGRGRSRARAATRCRRCRSAS